MLQVRVVSEAGECSTSGLDDTAKVDYVSGQLARSSVVISRIMCIFISIVFHPSVTRNVSIWLDWAKPRQSPHFTFITDAHLILFYFRRY